MDINNSNTQMSKNTVEYVNKRDTLRGKLKKRKELKKTVDREILELEREIRNLEEDISRV